MTFERKWSIAAAVVSVLGSLGAGSAWAAEDVNSASKVTSLEEVVVTAQRREENPQRVPIAINTVSGDELVARGVGDIHTLSSAVPNIDVTGGSPTHVFIRGVGVKTTELGNEPSTAIYVDGVYMPSSLALSSVAFNNIERVEVLKGPQGTLFGRNTTAGVVQIITPDPKHDVGGSVDLGYGNYQTVTADAYLTGGITDNLAANVSALYEDQNEGFGRYLTLGTKAGWHKNFAIRSKWLYTPSEATKVSVALDYNKASYDAIIQMAPGSINGRDHVTTYPGKFLGTGNGNGVSGGAQNDPHKEYGGSVRIDHDFGTLHGASITSYRNVSGNSGTDGDATPLPLIRFDIRNDADYVTQELQLSNRDPGKVTWLAGAYFYSAEVKTNPQYFQGTLAPGGGLVTWGVQKIHSAAAYGQATAEISANTKLTLGLRYTDETVKAVGRNENLAGLVTAGPFSNEVKASPWTWRVALDHQFTPDVLGYVSYNRGFKSGGYNLGSPGSAPFKPEQLDAYEVGLKSEFLDRRVRLNLAAFYYDYKDIQVSISLGGAQIFANAGAARNYGFDASLDFVATDRLTFSTGLGLVDAKYTDYPNVRAFTSAGVAYIIPNAKGNYLPYAPPVTGFVSGEYRIPTSVGEFKASANVSYTAKAYITPDNGNPLPARTLVNAALEWQSQSAKPLGVRLWGKNLTNVYYYTDRLSSSTGWYQFPAAPLTYGVTFTKKL